MTNYSFGKLLKRSVSRGGLAVLLGFCCMSAVGQESDRQDAADVKSASLERAEPVANCQGFVVPLLAFASCRITRFSLSFTV